MHILTYTIALEDGTDEDKAQLVRTKTLVMVTKFMGFMGQGDATIASTLESVNEGPTDS